MIFKKNSSCSTYSPASVVASLEEETAANSPTEYYNVAFDSMWQYFDAI